MHDLVIVQLLSETIETACSYYSVRIPLKTDMERERERGGMRELQYYPFQCWGYLRTKNNDATTFENHLNRVMLVFIG